MPKPRTGSVFYHAQRRYWVGVKSMGAGQKRRYFYGHSEEEVREKLAAEGMDPPRTPSRSLAQYRELQRRIALAVLARAELKGWDITMTAKVLAASMTKARIIRAVVGPCVYCGDELADTVDHVVASSNGGADDADNVASACIRCNARKGVKDRISFLTVEQSAVRRSEESA